MIEDTPSTLAAVESISQNRMTATGRLQTDLMHAASAKTNQQERLNLALGIKPCLEDLIVETRRFGMLLVRCGKFSPGLIGNFAHDILPSPFGREFAGDPSQILFGDRANCKLVAESSQSPLITSDDDRTTGHAIEPMRHTDEWLWSIRQRDLLDQL